MLGVVPWKGTVKHGASSTMDELDAVIGSQVPKHKSDMSLNTL